VGKHRLHMDATLDCFEGLSGSPIFVEATPSTMLLAGLLIQGSASSGLAQFVGAVPLAAMLHQLPQAAVRSGDARTPP
jgi:hypothetical protein